MPPKPLRLIQTKRQRELNDLFADAAAPRHTRDLPVEERVIRRTPVSSSLRLAVKDRGLKLQTIPYLLFVFLFFLIIFLQRSIHDAFLVEDTIAKGVLDQGFTGITDMDSAVDWLVNGMPNALYKTSWYEGTPLSDAENTNHTMIYVNHVLGGVRLLQRRVREGTCTVSKRFNKFAPVCWGPLNKGNEDKSPFGPVNDPTRYTYRKDRHGVSGYIVDLPLDRGVAQTQLQQLKVDRWWDRATREVRVDFTVYNHNVNLFTFSTLILEFKDSGLVVPSHEIQSMPLEPYLTGVDQFRMALEIMFVLLTLILLGYDIFVIVQHTRDGVFRLYHWNIWSVMRLLNYALALASISLWLSLMDHDIKKRLVLPEDEYIDMTPLSGYIRAYEAINAVTMLVLIIRIFELTQFDPKVSFMTDTLKAAWDSLRVFFLFFFIVFFSFAAMGMHLFGHSLEEWSTFTKACNTSFQLTTGEYPYATLLIVDPYVASIFYYSYMILVFFTLLNMAIGIIADAYLNMIQERRDTETVTSSYTLSRELAELREVWTSPEMDFWRPDHGLLILKHCGDSSEVLDKDQLDKAAELLHFPPRTVYQFLARYGVDPGGVHVQMADLRSKAQGLHLSSRHKDEHLSQIIKTFTELKQHLQERQLTSGELDKAQNALMSLHMDSNVTGEDMAANGADQPVFKQEPTSTITAPAHTSVALATKVEPLSEDEDADILDVVAEGPGTGNDGGIDALPHLAVDKK